MTDEIKNWGEVFYEGYVSTVPENLLFVVPTWSELPDRVQLACEEKARELVSPVFKKNFGDHPEAERAVFDIGQGNLDRAEDELRLNHPEYR